MKGYLFNDKRAQSSFKSFTLRQILRGQNSHADLLAMLATSSRSGLARVITVEDLIAPNYDDQLSVKVNSIQVGLSWMNPLVSFLNEGLLPEDKGKDKKMRRKAPRYWLSKSKSCIKTPTRDHIYCAFI